MRQPQGRARWIGQILLAEHFQAWFALNELCQHGVGTRSRQTGIEHFNHNVNVFDALLNGLAGEVHVTGKPLNCHSAENLTLKK